MGETAPGRRRRTRVAAPGARPPIPSQGGRGPCHAVAPRGDEATTHRERLRRRLRGGGRHARAACRGPAPPAAHLEARAEGHAQAKLQTRARAGRRPRRSRGCAVGAGSLPPRGARRAGERLAALRRPAFARIRLRPCRRGGHPRESLRLSRHLRRWKDDAGTRTPRSRGDVLLGRVCPSGREGPRPPVRQGPLGTKGHDGRETPRPGGPRAGADGKHTASPRCCRPDGIQERRPLEASDVDTRRDGACAPLPYGAGAGTAGRGARDSGARCSGSVGPRQPTGVCPGTESRTGFLGDGKAQAHVTQAATQRALPYPLSSVS